MFKENGTHGSTTVLDHTSNACQCNDRFCKPWTVDQYRICMLLIWGRKNTWGNKNRIHMQVDWVKLLKWKHTQPREFIWRAITKNKCRMQFRRVNNWVNFSNIIFWVAVYALLESGIITIIIMRSQMWSQFTTVQRLRYSLNSSTHFRYMSPENMVYFGLALFKIT